MRSLIQSNFLRITMATGALVAIVACGGEQENQGYNQAGEFEFTITPSGEIQQAIYSTVASTPSLNAGTIRAQTISSIEGDGTNGCAAGQNCFVVEITNNIGATAIGLYMGLDSITPSSGRALVSPDPVPSGVTAPLGGRLFGNIAQAASVQRNLNITIPNLGIYVVKGRYWVNDGIVSRSYAGPTVQVQGVSQYATPVGSVNFVAGDFPAGATVQDVNVTINFRKIAGGTCAAPTGADARHNQTSLRLTGPTGQVVNLARSSAPTTYAGSAVGGSIAADFDQDAGTVLTPGQLPFSGTYRSPVGNLDGFNGLTPFGTWRVFAGASTTPLCVQSYTVTVTAF